MAKRSADANHRSMAGKLSRDVTEADIPDCPGVEGTANRFFRGNQAIAYGAIWWSKDRDVALACLIHEG
jgi:hypothetical protein